MCGLVDIPLIGTLTPSMTKLLAPYLPTMAHFPLAASLIPPLPIDRAHDPYYLGTWTCNLPLSGRLEAMASPISLL